MEGNDQNRISSKKFSNLILALNECTYLAEKQNIGAELSECLLQPNGFMAYYDFVSSVSTDSTSTLDLFCRLVLSRPARYSSIIDYLSEARGNFTSILDHFLQTKNDESLLKFSAKLYYLMRRNGCEDQFVIFFQTDRSDCNDYACKYLSKLVEGKFYQAELCCVYSSVFAKILIERQVSSTFYWNNQASITYLLDSLDFETLLSTFSLMPSNFNLNDLVHLGKNNSSLVQAAVVHSFPDTHIIKEFSSVVAQIEFSDSFVSCLDSKVSGSPKFDDVWMKEIFSKMENSHPDSSLVSNSQYFAIIADLASEEAASKAHGLYNLRKNLERHASSLASDNMNVLKLLRESLLHEDSYVYMNAIKTITEAGLINRDLICKFLLDSINHFSDTSKMPRVIEVFDNLLSSASGQVTDYVQKFVLLTLKHFNDENFEVRLSILNFFIQVARSCGELFLRVSDEIWKVAKLPQKIFQNSRLEETAFLTLIDEFLSLIDPFNRKFIQDKHLRELSNFLQSVFKTKDQELAPMAMNSLIKLGKIRETF